MGSACVGAVSAFRTQYFQAGFAVVGPTLFGEHAARALQYGLSDALRLASCIRPANHHGAEDTPAFAESGADFVCCGRRAAARAADPHALCPVLHQLYIP